ncbi:MAG TPA: TldD/PmbA family protein [Gemmatimonadaceae bacterium]|nr:TldD/PmbA family protein [Gemmatimonadaceae bacterium]
MKAPLPRAELEDIAARIFRYATADTTIVSVGSTVTGNTRFAVNELTTVGDVIDTSVDVEVSFGSKHAGVQTNDLSDAALQAAVRRAESLAKLAPEDPETMPPLGPQTYQDINAYFDSTIVVGAAERAHAILTALEPARRSGASGFLAAGSIVTTAASSLLANTEGLSAYWRETDAGYTLTVRSADGTGSGWSSASEHDWTRLDAAAVAARALDTARRSRKAIPIEPGRYTVILEPEATSDIIELLPLDARDADEGRSPFAKPGGGTKLGEPVVDARVTLFADPADPDLLAQPFDGDGFPMSRQVWIERGVLRQMQMSRFWAKKQGRPYTGGATSFKFAGGSTSREAMIRTTERGLLITRFWYIVGVDPQTALHTGLTRDGVFLIEHGEVTTAVKNLRFNESPLFVLNNLDALGPVKRVSDGNTAMPVLKAHDFAFTSLSDAV